MLNIPFTSDPAQEFTVQLGDVGKFSFYAAYNDRSASWTFDITRDDDQVLLVAGVPLLIGQEMLEPYALGIGGLGAADLSNNGTDAGPDDLGERVVVTWLSPLEMLILGGDLLAAAPPPVVVPTAGGTASLTIVVNRIINQYATNNTTSTTVVGLQVPLVDNQQHADSSGAEVLVSQFAADLTPNPSATVDLNVSFYGSSAAGTATFRAYVGGTPGVIDGTLVATVTRSAAPFAPLRLVGVLVNPGGVVPVKITIQSNSAGIAAYIDDLTGNLG